MSSVDAPFCGPNSRAASTRRVRTSQERSRFHRQPVHDRAVPPHRRPSPSPRARRRARSRPVERGEDELAEPAARGAPRVTLLRCEQREPDRFRGLDDTASVRKQQPARRDLPPERVCDPHRPPLAAERRVRAAVPSPPSATGSSTASAPASRIPRASAAAATSASRTPLRLAGERSALTGGFVARARRSALVPRRRRSRTRSPPPRPACAGSSRPRCPRA